MALDSIFCSMRRVVVHAQRLHHALNALGAEQAQDIVLQGEEEPALARVALTAGAAAQLVVDPAGLVALGAQDEEAARGADLVRLGLDLGLVLGLCLGKGLPGVEDLLVVGLGVAGGTRRCSSSLMPALRSSALAMYSALPPSMMSVPRPAMLVATVTAPNLPAWATISASFSWCLAFSTLCLMPCLGEQLAQQLGLLDGHGAHQHGLALVVAAP